jgi:hypothetical protein
VERDADLYVPCVYVLNRKATEEQRDLAEQMLAITPCPTALITDHGDVGLAYRYSQIISYYVGPDVVPAAKQLAQEQKRPVLVIGDADFIDVVYPDDHTEKLCWSSQTKMN